ncbi:MAG TPA: peptidyl-prolyl cis-trans isomerase, partial [Spirochaetia bacterium]|nr:peptidyl-prolyl cis-trans isomerase [Spirochaetia bacterium]
GSPVASRIQGSGAIVFGSYAGKDISYYQGSYFAQDLSRLNSQRNTQGTASSADLQSIYYQAFIDTAEHIAILDQVDRAGGQVSNDAVDKSLLTYSGYLDDNGKFSEARYNATSGSERASTRKLYREDLLTNQFITDIVYGVKDGSKESAFIKDMVAPERKFAFVSYPFSGFPSDQVKAYGEANKSRFRKIKVSRILVKSSESQADEILKKIKDKASTFEELAKTYSKDGYADKGGDMGWRYAYDLEADFDAKDTAQKIFALKAGEVSDVLKGTFGWMIYRCDADATDPDFSDPAVQTDVRGYITQYEKGKIEDYFTSQASVLARRAADVGFDKAAAEAKLKVLQTAAFPVNLGNFFSFAPFQAMNQADTPSSAVYNEDFFYRAFSLGKDQTSQPVVLDDQVLVLKLLEESRLPDSTLNLLGSWITYIASQSVQRDLSAVLMTPDKLKDNFVGTFNRYFTARTSTQQ